MDLLVKINGFIGYNLWIYWLNIGFIGIINGFIGYN